MLLIGIKLKANFGKLNNNDNVIEEVGFTTPNPLLLHIDPSSTVTRVGALSD